MTSDFEPFFATSSTPLAIALNMLGVPWANEHFRCAMTYRDSFLRETKMRLVSLGKWPQEKPFTPQDAQAMDYVDQATFFFKKTHRLDAVMRGWEAGCKAIRDESFRIDVPDFNEEQAATILAVALGPNGHRSRMVFLMKNANAKLAMQNEDGDWAFIGKDASAETISRLNQ